MPTCTGHAELALERRSLRLGHARRAASGRRSGGSARSAPRPRARRPACPRGCPPGRQGCPRSRTGYRTPSGRRRSSRGDGSGALVHELDEPAEHGRIGGRQDAVAEVEDVAGPAAGALEDRARPRRARARTARAARAGSRLPWTPRSWPTSSQPRRAERASRGRSRRRPPRPSTAAGARCRCRSGSSARRRRRGSAREYGATNSR